MIIRRVGVWSVARLYGGISAVCGLLAGVAFAVVAAVGGLAGAADAGARGGGLAFGGLSALFGLGAVILLPICYGLLGLAGGAFAAALYNLFAGVFGGVELDLQQ